MDKVEVYVCYTQNYLGLIDGEEVVECMQVKTRQDEVDKWFLEMVADGKENGYVPEDEPETFLGSNEYEIRMSKGSDEEGYTSYGIVCRRYAVELDNQ